MEEPVDAPVIECARLRKAYRRRPALRGVDLRVTAGEVFALLGPNGAGKTTAVEILGGFLARDAGEVSVLGHDPGHAGPGWRRRVGVVPQETGALSELTVHEAVAHFAGLYPAAAPVPPLLRDVGLEEVAGRRIGRLSGGQRRRVDIALGMVGRPELLFLDEPTTGLDAVARRQVWDAVRELTRQDGTTVLLTSHSMEEVEELAARGAVLADGKVVAQGTIAELAGGQSQRCVVEFTGQRLLPPSGLPSGTDVELLTDDRVRIRTAQPSGVLRAVLDRAAELTVVEVPGLRVSRPTLESGYLSLMAELTGPAEEVAA
ncbi:ABC transporter ATP-binding protein [Streptomyces sp. NBC_01089]|uniref:ABC transporter ATP-binding protein n=1 Tax=Streptomyces sp. NBC_01089 TaxID=2903747 RepID=UPI00386F16D5|nr:ABC transporter ATP-binding protein [Streptomyces sp. NBC_01089]